ncbi:MAG TPA: lysophospholipid acyltransferase family protein [Acidobacteriota bacterium]|nr:lysophospholipid acyltransferase family protein [Acidobacteriota bacterium]
MLSYPTYVLVRVATFFLRVLPRPLGTAIIKTLATATYYLDSRHRHIARVNLTIAFPELSPRERDRIARRSFQNTGMNLLEISRLPDLTTDTIGSLVTYDAESGLNNYEAARAKKKGILYLTGHFSAWELLPAAHALHGHPLSFVTRPLDNDFLDRYMRMLRESKGNSVIPKKNSARQILKTLKSNGTAGILIDQNTSLQEGMFADFFGLPAATTSGMAFLALHTDAPVLPGYLTPMRNGRYTIKFLPPIETKQTGDMQRDLAVYTRAFNEVLEKIIREQPESWLWGHKRWKYQPPENPQNLYNLSEQDLARFLKKIREQKP